MDKGKELKNIEKKERELNKIGIHIPLVNINEEEIKPNERKKKKQIMKQKEEEENMGENEINERQK